MLVVDARGSNIKVAYSKAGLTTALYVAMSVSFCFPHAATVSVFNIWTEML